MYTWTRTKNKTPPSNWKSHLIDSGNCLMDELSKLIIENELYTAKGNDVLSISSYLDTNIDACMCLEEAFSTDIPLKSQTR